MKTVKNGKGSRARTTPDDAYRSEIDRIFKPAKPAKPAKRREH